MIRSITNLAVMKPYGKLKLTKQIIKNLLVFNEKFCDGNFDIDLEILVRLRLIKPVAIAPKINPDSPVVLFGEYDYYVIDVENNPVSRDIKASRRILLPLLPDWHFSIDDKQYRLIKMIEGSDCHVITTHFSSTSVNRALLVCRMMLLGLVYDLKDDLESV